MKGAIAIRKPVATVRLSMATTNITQAAWTQILASLPFGASSAEIVNNSGSSMQISKGSVGHETDPGMLFPYTIPPGGAAGVIAMEFGARNPVSLKALNQDATTGEFVMNFFA